MTDPTAPTSPLPAAIGRFQIVRKLGAGGMGDVYEGFDAAVSRYAAVKILRRAMVEHSEVAEHFVLEAQRIAKLEAHPNIPTVYEVGVHEGLPFLAMQKVDGGSLAALLKKRGVASLALLRSVASGIGSALAFAHERSIVHCDVKPQNVLVDRAGKPYLTDFGISRARPDPLGGNESPLQGLTPYYASPEQSRGAVADARSDVYSFGILLYEMCTGINPWVHVAADELAQALATQKPARADARNRLVPKSLADALEAAINADPMRRPGALELARRVLRATDAAARWTVERNAELGIEGELAAAPGIGITEPRSVGRRTFAAAAVITFAIAATVWTRDVDAEPSPDELAATSPARAGMLQQHDAPGEHWTAAPTLPDETSSSAESTDSGIGAGATGSTPIFAHEHAHATTAPRAPAPSAKLPLEGQGETPAPDPAKDPIAAIDDPGPRPEPKANPSTPPPTATNAQELAIENAENARRSVERVQAHLLQRQVREAASDRHALESIGGVFQSIQWILERDRADAPTPPQTGDAETAEVADPTGAAADSVPTPAPRPKLDPRAAVPKLPTRNGLAPGLGPPGKRDRR